MKFDTDNIFDEVELNFFRFRPSLLEKIYKTKLYKCGNECAIYKPLWA